MSYPVTQSSLTSAIEDADKTPPSLSMSAFAGFISAWTEPEKLAFNVQSSLYGLKRKNPVSQGLSAINEEMKSPSMGWTQNTANFVGSLGGFVGNPVNALLGYGAAGAAEKGIAALSGALPEAISAFGQTSAAKLLGEEAASRMSEFVPKTIGGVGSTLAKTFAVASAESIPQAFNENFNEKTGKFDIIGGAEQTLKYGSLGLGIHTLGVAGGMIYGKIAAGRAFKMPELGDSSKENLDEIDKAFQEGKIDEHEYRYAHTYLTDPNNMESLQKLGAQVLTSAKYNVDSVNNKVFMNIASKETIDNLHSSIFDQLSSNASGDLKTAMSDYQYSNAIDGIRSESGHMADGLKGFASFMGNRLSKAKDNLAKFKKIRDSSGYENITNEHPISQRSVFKHIRKGKYDFSLFPHAIPKNLSERFAQEQKISSMSTRYKSYRKKIKRGEPVKDSIREKINKLDQNIEHIKSNLTKTMSPSKELSHLEEHFLSKDNLPDNFQRFHEYHRLKDLSNFSEKAKALLHHVDLKNEYEVQTGYKDMVDSMTKLMTSDVQKYADPKKLQAYLQQRMESSVPEMKDMGQLPDHVAPNQREIKSPDEAFRDKRERASVEDHEKDLQSAMNDEEQILKDNDQDIRRSGAEDLEKEFNLSKKRYIQFKKTSEDRDRLLSCVRE